MWIVTAWGHQESRKMKKMKKGCLGVQAESQAPRPGDTDLLLYSNKLIYFSINYHRIDFFFFFICGSCQLQILEQSIREWKHFFFFLSLRTFSPPPLVGSTTFPLHKLREKLKNQVGNQLFLIHRLSVSCPCKLISSYSSWSRLRKSPSCLLSSLHISFFKY